jgi:hypothetical protein
LCKQQQNARQSPFAEVEELIYQVFLDSNNSGKQISNKQFCKLWVSRERARSALLAQANDIGLPNRCRRANPGRLPCETAFAKEATSLQKG